MNKNQKNFLDELATLLRRYNINSIEVKDGSRIVFFSNYEQLAFSSFVKGPTDGGTFSSITTKQDNYNTEKIKRSETNRSIIMGVEADE